MVEVTPENGLVAFFDILGYSQMLLSNEVELTASLIVDVLAKVPDEVLSTMTKEDPSAIKNEHLKSKEFIDKLWDKIIHKEISWLLFSDSILVSLPLTEMAPNDFQSMFYNGIRVTAFLHVCAFLLRKMFDKGLPLRGAVSFGEFFIKDNYFAGKPIIESYQISESIELSGCVLTPSVGHIFDQMKDYAQKNNFPENLSMLNQLVVPHLVPEKREKLTKRYTINWVKLPMLYFQQIPSDIREYVYSSFVDFNKDTPPIVYAKINNTETYIRKLMVNIESKPWGVVSKNLDKVLQEYDIGEFF
ncbi:MAG: hypothetical protein ACXAD7_05200 [Candidatus Kariarchaeaceae archaeon]|jgi:hypothetical protein